MILPTPAALPSLRRGATSLLPSSLSRASSGVSSSRYAQARYFSSSRTNMSLEASMRRKLEAELSPQALNIRNDSSKHAHHAAMISARAAADASSDPSRAHERLLETHFHVECVSEKFEGLPTIKRHRLVNGLVKEEFEQGLHALSLRLKTPKEIEKEQQSA